MIRRFNVGTLRECMDSWHYECLVYCGVKEVHSSAHSAVAHFFDNDYLRREEANATAPACNIEHARPCSQHEKEAYRY
jgi:hypothetical protein